MSDFKAKMHQIRFPSGAPPQTLGEFKALPRTLAVFKGQKGRGWNRRAPILCWDLPRHNKIPHCSTYDIGESNLVTASGL